MSLPPPSPLPPPLPPPRPNPSPGLAAPPAPTPAPVPHRQRRSLLWRGAIATLLALLLALLVAASLAWALGTTAGARALLALLPGLQAQGVQGRLLGDFAVQQLRWRLGSRRELVIDALAWQGLQLSLPGPGPARLQVARLQAQRLDLQGPSDDPNPVVLPTHLILPLQVDLDEVRVDEVLFDAIRTRPVRGLAGRLQLGAGPAALHRLEGLQARWDRVLAEGEATLGAAAPLALDAALRLRPAPPVSPPAPEGSASAPTQAPADWSARLTGRGPLARLQIHAELAARGQSLQADAEVEPVARQPLAHLQARLAGLDLAPLATGLPRTALTGQIDARLSADSPGRAANPLGLQVALDNQRPGRLDAGELPLRRIELEARGQISSIDQGRIERLRLQLATATPDARQGARRDTGQIEAEGHWALVGSGAERRLDLGLTARLTALQPAQLHQAAPALHLGGPLALELAWPLGAPSPAPTTAAGEAAAASGTLHQLAPDGARLDLRTDLTGHLIGAGLPAVRLRVELLGDAQHVELKQLRAESGTAHLEATGQLRRDAASWRLQLHSGLHAFDPLVWWPGPGDHPLRRGPHRLDGQARIDLQLPDRRSAAPATGLTRLAALRGEAQLHLDPSMLAGVPMQGELQLRSSQSDVALGPVPHLLADLQLHAGNAPQATELRLHADLDPNHGQDRWRLNWSSPALQALAPWWRLIDPTHPLALAGDTQGQLELDGRWPRLRSRGQLQAGSEQPLRGWQQTTATAGPAQPATPPQWQVAGVQARWQAGSDGNDPIDVDIQARRLGGAEPLLQALQLRIEGRNSAHRMQALADFERAGEAATETTPAAPPRRFTVQAQGAGDLRLDLSAARFAWQGELSQASLQELLAPGGNGTPSVPSVQTGQAPPAGQSPQALPQAAPPTLATLISLATTPLRLSHGPEGSSVQVGRTQATLADARLRLDELTWRDEPGSATPGAAAAAAAPQRSLQLRAELEPLAIAPLLARAQPGFGWGGDLRMGGRIEVQATPQHFNAHAEIGRLQGDLLVQDPDNPAGPQRLGLDDLRLAISARDGQWRLTQQVAGGNLGRLDGEQSVQAPPGAFWPPAGAPLSGRIDLRIAQLGHWGRWLPAGWRLSGQLDTHAAVAGRVGAPEFSGELVGQRLAVRNLLQGVDWRDAAVRIALAGDTARIEQFSVQAGAGRLAATGQIQFGANPRLVAQIEASRFAAQQRVDRRIVASGQAELTVDARSTALKGRLVIDEGRFDFTQRDAPSLADDVSVERHGSDAATTERPATAARGPQRSTVLDLRVGLGQQLHLAGRGLATRLTGELRLTTPANKLAIHGDVQAEEGSYTAYGQKLSIDRGIILFGGAADNPRLDIEATKPDLEDLRVGVAITGTAQSPRIRLFSEPELTETDKLSYLLLGRASDGLGRTDLSLLQRAAFALITGEDDSPSLIERIGLDQLSVRKEDGDTRETVVSLGKQLSRRWYLGYERGLNAASGSWQLIYRAAQRFTFRAQTGTENALDLIWTWKWGTPGMLPLPIPGAATSAGPAPAQAPAASPSATKPQR